MAVFEIAFKRLLGYEGGYSNDHADKGGETYKGIARNFHPDWSGWKLVDEIKKSPGFQKELNSNAELTYHVKQFYKYEFWDKFDLDNIRQHVAEEIFEVAVNTGVQRAVKIVQTTCNLLNRNGSLYPDISTDSKWGTVTKNTLKTCLQKNDDILVFNVLNILQGAFYIELMLNNTNYEKYIGWFNRIEILK